MAPNQESHKTLRVTAKPALGTCVPDAPGETSAPTLVSSGRKLTLTPGEHDEN